MKLGLSVVVAFIILGTYAWFPVSGSSISMVGSDIKLDTSILMKARRLEQDDDGGSNLWMADYSLKFLGCHAVDSFNNDGEGDEDSVSVSRKLMARFRLCSSNTCRRCRSNYGNYVVDLESFAGAYMEGKRRSIEYKCQLYMYYHCDCEDGDDKDDGFNREYCEYDCFKKGGKSECIDRNPYEEEDEGRRFEAEEYTECRELDIPDDDGGRRLGGDDDSSLYVGPYCTADSKHVRIGVFTDQYCTIPVANDHGSSTFRKLMGFSLPYRSSSMIQSDCISCLELQDMNRQDENDDDSIEIAGQCEETYESAGKCEEHYASGSGPSYPSTGECSYIEGIKKFGGDGSRIRKRRSLVATFLILFFALACVSLVFYALHLRKKMERTSLLDSIEMPQFSMPASLRKGFFS